MQRLDFPLSRLNRQPESRLRRGAATSAVGSYCKPVAPPRGLNSKEAAPEGAANGSIFIHTSLRLLFTPLCGAGEAIRSRQGRCRAALERPALVPQGRNLFRVSPFGAADGSSSDTCVHTINSSSAANSCCRAGEPTEWGGDETSDGADERVTIGGLSGVPRKRRAGLPVEPRCEPGGLLPTRHLSV